MRDTFKSLLFEVWVEGEYALDPPLSHDLEVYAIHQAELATRCGEHSGDSCPMVSFVDPLDV